MIYRWTTAMGLDSAYLESNAYGDSLIHFPYRGICMEGFHIPRAEEFKELLDYVDLHNGEESLVASLSNGSQVDYGGVDRFGFNHQDVYGYLYGYYASCSEVYGGWRSYMPYVYGLHLYLGDTGPLPVVEKQEFFYVRCLKD
ncbi:hypothetical protein [uncultured Fibrobacter sp.]|uniref:hypothetical protein n=1 Tax=uncultured Fibrobacter sp. TaxID=261512 RepID=UPI002803B95D|nr:hypothetical protein [uncultured Fibrobacter sp.]